MSSLARCIVAAKSNKCLLHVDQSGNQTSLSNQFIFVLDFTNLLFFLWCGSKVVTHLQNVKILQDAKLELKSNMSKLKTNFYKTEVIIIEMLFFYSEYNAKKKKGEESCSNQLLENFTLLRLYEEESVVACKETSEELSMWSASIFVLHMLSKTKKSSFWVC